MLEYNVYLLSSMVAPRVMSGLDGLIGNATTFPGFSDE